MADAKVDLDAVRNEQNTEPPKGSRSNSATIRVEEKAVRNRSSARAVPGTT